MATAVSWRGMYREHYMPTAHQYVTSPGTMPPTGINRD